MVDSLCTLSQSKAEKLLESMLEDGLTPNVITYTSLMVVLRRGGQHEKSIRILDLMKSEARQRDHFDIGGGGESGMDDIDKSDGGMGFGTWLLIRLSRGGGGGDTFDWCMSTPVSFRFALDS